MFPDQDHKNSDVKSLKDALRTEVRRRRAGIHSQARAAAAQALVIHAAALPLHRTQPNSQIIGLYWPIGTELDTVPLLHHLHAQGYMTALPRTVGAASALRFFRWEPTQALGQDLLGFPTPLGTEEVTPDLLLIPLVAFDRSGNRLGQGAGFYDRTLSALRRANSGLQAIGLAFACQEVEAIPAALHDQRLDGILTEQGYRAFGHGLTEPGEAA